MEERPPPKFARFLIWVTTQKELREDVLAAFDELHNQTAQEFGHRYAYMYSTLQGIRSVPYGMISIIFKVVGVITRIGG